MKVVRHQDDEDLEARANSSFVGIPTFFLAILCDVAGIYAVYIFVVKCKCVYIISDKSDET